MWNRLVQRLQQLLQNAMVCISTFILFLMYYICLMAGFKSVGIGPMSYKVTKPDFRCSFAFTLPWDGCKVLSVCSCNLKTTWPNLLPMAVTWSLLLVNNLGQVVHTCMTLSPSSIIWYRCRSRWGNSRLWKWWPVGSLPFYARQHICYSAYMPWQFRLSVCPSVRLYSTLVDQSKTVEARITQFSPYSSPIPLVFWG